MAAIIPQSTNSGVRYFSTAKAYDLWSSVYDTDGNFLQALDTAEMKTLLPRMLQILEDSSLEKSRSWKFVDLGCGTGRNTTALLEVRRASSIVGLDVSPGMLEVAKTRLERFHAEGRLELEVFDMVQNSNVPEPATQADAVVSTLVLEHVPAEVFFDTVARILKPGGVLLLTNMHSEMGSISQAGFIDPRTGEKIRPTSYAHTTAQVEAAALRSEFELVGSLLERAVDQTMTASLGERSKKWIGVTVWFGAIYRRN